MTVRSYEITRRGPKHFRWEDSHGKPVTKTVHRRQREVVIGGKVERIEGEYFEPIPGTRLVGYGIGEGLNPVIKLEEGSAEFKLLQHMKLVPVVGSVAAEAPNSVADAQTQPSRIDVPGDWEKLPAVERKALASKIADDEVPTAREADEIIAEYLTRK